MARKCKVSGKAGQFGNRVSHAKNRRKHLFKPNIQKRKIFVPELGHNVTVKLSTRVIRTMDKIGVEATLKKYNLSYQDLV